MFRADQNSRALRNERDFVAAVVDHSAALVLILDPEGRITRFNPSCERTSGRTLTEVQGQHVWELESTPEERDERRVRFERLLSDRKTNDYEGTWTRPDGSHREIAWSNSLILDRDGDVEYVVCTGLDITERTRAEERVRFLASYDPLTGLPNRRLVAERLQKAISAADGNQVAILILDIDRFKDVNGSWGHAAGDRLLKAVSDRLVKSLRLSDALGRHCPDLRTELGRLGGDEFAVLVTGVPDGTEVATIADRLQHALDRAFRLDERAVAVTATVGAAMFPADGDDSETLLKNAESAMHAAREGMRGSFHFYSKAMHARVSERLSLEHELRQAIDRGELRLHYQDKILAGSRRVVGAEALVRWQHPTRGLLAPGAFIDVAEETGLIVPLGEWVLREACNQVTSWLEAGVCAVPVAVNLSSAQFHVSDLLERVASALNESTLDPGYLEVEVTESMIMRDATSARNTLRRLEELGVKIAIDDFGTGYSTLSYLKDLPVHCLKIDSIFIRDITDSSESLAITRAIVAMAHGLDLTVVAEGVVTEDQIGLLRDEGCDAVQGFLVGKPLPSDEFSEYLERSDPETHVTDAAPIDALSLGS